MKQQKYYVGGIWIHNVKHFFAENKKKTTLLCASSEMTVLKIRSLHFINMELSYHYPTRKHDRLIGYNLDLQVKTLNLQKLHKCFNLIEYWQLCGLIVLWFYGGILTVDVIKLCVVPIKHYRVLVSKKTIPFLRRILFYICIFLLFFMGKKS